MISLVIFVVTTCVSSFAIKMDQVLPPVFGTADPGPYVAPAFSGNITARLGSTARLNCRVLQLNRQTVSWLRVSSVPVLLSVGAYTYTMDNRIQVEHTGPTSDWTLVMTRVRHNDSGPYECQLGTTPPKSHRVYLSVTEPITEILGGPDFFIDDNSAINLTCVVTNSGEKSGQLSWLHNGQRLGHDTARGGVNVITTLGTHTVSQLLVAQARGADSGTYTCRPSGAKEVTAVVHILNGKRPEAMQSVAVSPWQHRITWIAAIIFLLPC